MDMKSSDRKSLKIVGLTADLLSIGGLLSLSPEMRHPNVLILFRGLFLIVGHGS
jgi:hypothetical protein